MRLTDPSNTKGKRLERAIRRLENFILTSKPPLIDVQEADASSGAVERSLPQELKEKLAEIASLTRLINGNISEELIDRLMGILGKYLHRKNLKRMLREMVIKEFSVINEGDNDIKQFKKDIVEMIRVRATLEAKASEHQDDSANDFQRLPSSEEKVGRNVFIMDNKVEDKLCDLYDAFVQGLDDYIAHSLARRLYAQLAALWPKGTMDKHEIQKAICRAQERKRILSSQTDKDGEKYKTSKLSIPRTDGYVNGKDSSGSQARTVHKKL